MYGGWRTGPHAGKAATPMDDTLSAYSDGQYVRGQRICADERAPDRCPQARYCQACGKEVCTYKDAHMDKVWCYAHDHLTPWTHPYLTGNQHVFRKKNDRIEEVEESLA